MDAALGVTSLEDLSAGEFVVVLAVAAGLATAVFWHADRRGSRHATAWGVATFLAAGLVVPVYLLSVLLGGRRR